MKIKELLENTGEYIVYQVSSPNTDRVYYGYAAGEDPKASFLGQSVKRMDRDPERGDVRFLQAAGDQETLQFKMLDVFANEIEAFMERNDLRSRDRFSITGPTNFPVQMFQRAREIDPERVKNWRLGGNINTVSAREAMGDQFKDVSNLSFDVLKRLVATNPKLKPQVMQDLDKLLYPDFMKKYFEQQ